MANGNLINAILKTITDVQAKNKANPNEETADPNVFDLIKSKLGKLDEKNRAKRVSRGKSPTTILDRIRKEITGARNENRKDPNVKTAPSSVFDSILKKIDNRPKQQASTGLRKIVNDYNLDVGRLPKETISQIQQKYQADRKAFDQQYAQAIHDLIKKH